MLQMVIDKREAKRCATDSFAFFSHFAFCSSGIFVFNVYDSSSGYYGEAD